MEERIPGRRMDSVTRALVGRGSRKQQAGYGRESLLWGCSSCLSPFWNQQSRIQGVFSVLISISSIFDTWNCIKPKKCPNTGKRLPRRAIHDQTPRSDRFEAGICACNSVISGPFSKIQKPSWSAFQDDSNALKSSLQPLIENPVAPQTLTEPSGQWPQD